MTRRSTITRAHADHVECAKCHTSRRCLGWRRLPHAHRGQCTYADERRRAGEATSRANLARRIREQISARMPLATLDAIARLCDEVTPP